MGDLKLIKMHPHLIGDLKIMKMRRLSFRGPKNSENAPTMFIGGHRNNETCPGNLYRGT